jgi:response regulator RpfG family c-di-GMP phosphodiesterase
MDFLSPSPPVTAAPWKVLLVDDEPEIHEVTRLVLAGFQFEGRPLLILSAVTATEAKQILAQYDDIAVILLDVVMESDQAGLKLVEYIRNELGNKNVRIVLRTGQPGQAPEHEVITKYDINDYKEKTELTAQKLATTMFASLRAYRDIMIIEANKRGLERVIAASAHIFSHEKPAEFASAVLSQLANLVGLQRGALYCRVGKPNDASGHITVAAATGDFERFVDTYADEELPTHMRESLDAALRSKQHQFRKDHYVLHFTDSQQTESLLYVGESWDLDDLDFRLVEVFCTNVSIAYENLHLSQELVEAQMEMIFLLAGAAESRSQETAAHVKRVGELCAFLGEKLGMDEATCEQLRYASPLHDIGKIGIPDAVLNKPGSHDDDEMKVMRGHAEIGHRMLSHSRRGILRLAAEIALTHHENWDGSGYPRGLAGEDIPLSGRVTMIADVFDALGSRRCYKSAWDSGKIREFILAQSGVKFDPKVVQALLDHWDEAEAIRARLPDEPRPE